MSCEGREHLISAYIDGELPATDRRVVAAHIEQCPSCAVLAADLRSISRAVAGNGREPMSASLPLRVRASLAQAAVAPSGEGSRIGRWRLSRRAVGFLSQAAAVIVACALSSLTTLWITNNMAREERLEQDLLSAHLRSLLQDNPVQVASSDSHTVKPWFAGKVEFSPEVRELAAQGFPLVGGRLDSVEGRRVGAIVYRRQLHLINVFAWPSKGSTTAPPAAKIYSGYNLLTWTRDGVTYWAISDVEASELARLPGLL